MKQVRLQKIEECGDDFPPDNTTVFFKAWMTQKDCVWTIGRRFIPSGKKKVRWQDYSMGVILKDSQVVEWSLIPEHNAEVSHDAKRRCDMRIHVIPVGGDEPMHAASNWCWCHPLATDAGITIHHAEDCREKDERQGVETQGKAWVNVIGVAD